MPLSNDIRVITDSDHVEALLAPYRNAIGGDFEGYRGHIYRVLSYALHFLGDDLESRQTIETALVYHDLGLWSDRELAYLEPSVSRALKDNAEGAWGHDELLLRNIIYWHHKMTPFRGEHANIVNAVRKADWIDASSGLLKMGMPKSCIEQVKAAIPEAGFYDTLKRIGPELTGSTLKSLAAFSKVFKI